MSLLLRACVAACIGVAAVLADWARGLDEALLADCCRCCCPRPTRLLKAPVLLVVVPPDTINP